MDHAEFVRGWSSGRPETLCGAGSTIEQTRIQRETLPRWVEQHDIHSLVDIGAGDLNWIQLVDWPHPVEYTALDLVPRNREVKAFDLIYQIPPPADCGMCLWLLNHLPIHRALAAAQNLMAAEYRCLIYTWWPGMDERLDFGYTDNVVIRESREAELRILC
jgi:hypothetical protein